MKSARSCRTRSAFSILHFKTRWISNLSHKWISAVFQRFTTGRTCEIPVRTGMSLSVVKFAFLFSRILRHSRNSRKFSPAIITEITVCNYFLLHMLLYCAMTLALAGTVLMSYRQTDRLRQGLIIINGCAITILPLPH